MNTLNFKEQPKKHKNVARRKEVKEDEPRSGNSSTELDGVLGKGNV
jgi:hypothetical protein